jgi:hypothetical protein
MAFQVSPGIVTTEVDLTASPQTVAVSDAGFAGPFKWGPALDPQNVGSEEDLVTIFGKPDDTIGASWFSAQSFLAYSNLLRVTRAISANALNGTASAKAITGTVDATNATSTFTTHTVSGFVTTGLVKGQSLVIGTDSYVVNSVVNSTAFTVTTTVANGVVNAASISAYGLLIKNQTDYAQSYPSGATGYGAWASKWPGELGNSIKVSVCASANAFASEPTGSIALSSSSNVVTGTSTNFASDLVIGDYLVANGESIQVTGIVNATSAILASNPRNTSTVTEGNWSRKWEFASYFDGAPGTSGYASVRGGSADELHVVVVDAGGTFSGVPATILEKYAFLSKASNSKDNNAQSNYYVTVLNRQSQYVWWLSAPASSSTNWGSDASFTFGADALPHNTRQKGGQSDNANISDGNLETGFDTFGDKDTTDISFLITGPASATLASYVIQSIAEVREDCVAFVSPSQSAVVNNPGSEVSAITAFRNSLPSSSFAFMDSGWKWTYDKYNDVYRWVPLNGDIAGIAARSDTTNDPWFSPAGFARGNVKNVTKLAWVPKGINRDDLYKINVNSVVSFPSQGVVLYGDKTLLNRPSAFDRINVRRLFIVLEKTITRLAQASLFEFNDAFTQAQFRNVVEPYLRDVKSRRGLTEYRVVCDSTNNPTSVVDANKFVGDIYIKPSRSINFIQLNFVAVASGVSFQTITGTA